MFWEIFMYSYLITSGISLIVMPIRTYHIGKDQFGKRKSILTALMTAVMCLFPYVGFAALIYVAFMAIRSSTKEWISQDPTAPKNVADPNFVPPQKKEIVISNDEEVNNRAEILGL